MKALTFRRQKYRLRREWKMMTNDLKILSAGAVKPGLTKVIDAFQRDSGNSVQVSFATAPAILKQIGESATVDVVIAPTNVLEQLVKSGNCAVREAVTLGRIGVGVFVRNGESLPNISNVDGFKQSLLDAESVVYNQASTGTYLERLFESLAIGASINDKSTRYPDFAAVLDHVSKGKGREIGLGATTVIIENENCGVKFAGPLPAGIQNYTAYVAALIAESEAKEVARQFMRYLASSAAKSLLTAAGIQ
jgi:molybdate transport system substrate-binding protein